MSYLPSLVLTMNVGSISLSEAWGKRTKKKQILSDIH